MESCNHADNHRDHPPRLAVRLFRLIFVFSQRTQLDKEVDAYSRPQNTCVQKKPASSGSSCNFPPYTSHPRPQDNCA